jgi:hypothetical protein
MTRWRMLLVGLLWWPALVSAGVREVPPGARLIAPDHPAPEPARVAGELAGVRAALARGEVASALARLHAIGDAVEREATAVAAIDELQTLPPTAASDEFLAKLAQEPVRLYRRHEETAGDWFLPLYDVPGRAASARRVLALLGARDRLLPALRAGEIAPLLDKANDAAVLSAAIERLSPAEADRLVQRVAREGRGISGPAWAALAWRAPSPQALDAVLDRIPPELALPLLQQLPARLEKGRALPWLERALERSEYRSAAVAAIGGLAAHDPQAEARLVELLGSADPELGTSAAAAMARLDVPDRLARIDTLLATRKDRAVLARLALALRLEDSPGARDRLAKLAHDERLPADLRKELQR